jgi:cytochrome c oxidase subunit 4
MSTRPLTRSSLLPATLVYGLMLALTLVTWAVGTTGLQGLEVSLLVLAFALIKGFLVGDWFMGLRGVHGWWRWVVFVWLFVPGSLITIAFVLSYRV